MRILAVGGGSGGHVTPVVAVLKELRADRPDSEIRFWCDHKFAAQAKATLAQFDPGLRVDTIIAGKFRRYNHLPMWRQLLWFSLVMANLRDSVLIAAGLVQSLLKLVAWRPDVVFTKGGYVCLPVGVAAHVLRIPLVIHDSDAHPGLTNRVLARYATFIGTGAPLHFYHYPPEKARYVGIPVNRSFRLVSDEEQVARKEEWGIESNRPLVVVTGGGLGAQRMNDYVMAERNKLAELAAVILVSGAGQYDQLRTVVEKDTDVLRIYPFVTNMDSLLAAADVVVARAGATTILESAALAKPTILIPNAKLTGGHQVKNAAVYGDAQAVVIVDDDSLEGQPDTLTGAIAELLNRPAEAKAMALRFHEFAKPEAARDMARLILQTAVV